MEMLSVPLFTQAKSNPATLCNGSNVSTDSRKRGNCTKGTRKPRDNVLLGNGSACYRRVAQKTPLTGTAFIKVVHCAAKKDLLKCILTVDDIAGGKAFKNTQKVFRAGDRITIIHSKVYDEYGVGQVAIIQPHRMLGGTTTEKAATTKAVDKVMSYCKKQSLISSEFYKVLCEIMAAMDSCVNGPDQQKEIEQKEEKVDNDENNINKENNNIINTNEEGEKIQN